MRGDVAVPEGEPPRLGAVLPQLVPYREPLVGAAPALLLVDTAAECVHHGVQVGAHSQTKQRDVVTGVPDDGDVCIWHRGAQSGEEARGPDPTGEAALGGQRTAPRRLRSRVIAGTDRPGQEEAAAGYRGHDRVVRRSGGVQET